MVRRRDLGCQRCGSGHGRDPFGVGQDMVLAFLDLLARAIAGMSAVF